MIEGSGQCSEGAPKATAESTRLTRWMWTLAFWFPAITLLVLMASFAHNKRFASDFWVHAATVRAVQEHPFAPAHPILSVPSADLFIPPHAWLVAAAGLPSVDALAVFSVVSLLLFLVAFAFFVNRVSPHGGTPAIALFCVLMLWGADAWWWSGFFHFDVLFFVAAYPSTVAASLLFIGLGLAYSPRPPLVALVLLLAATVVTHLLTAVVFAIGLMVLLRPRRLALVLVGGTVLALAWPYLGVTRVQANWTEFHARQAPLYRDIVSRTWPTLVVVPAFLACGSRPLVLMFSGLVLLYGYGYLSGAFAFGRVASYACLVAQVGVADVLARRLRSAAAAVALMVVFVATTLVWHRPALGFARPGARQSSYPLAFLPQFVGADDIVLTDVRTGVMATAFAGKVVAEAFPSAAPDHAARQDAVRRFFDQTTGIDERVRTLQQYSVDWILIDKQVTPVAAIQSLLPLGTIAYEKGGYVLVHVGQHR